MPNHGTTLNYAVCFSKTSLSTLTCGPHWLSKPMAIPSNLKPNDLVLEKLDTQEKLGLYLVYSNKSLEEHSLTPIFIAPDGIVCAV